MTNKTEDKTITVPLQVLQDLIFNAELLTVGTGNGAIETQCRVLQECIDDGEIPSRVDFDNVVYARFGS